MDKYNSKLAKLVGWLARSKNNYAITIGQTTYYSCEKEWVYEEWRRHEECHKRQWREEGRLKFATKYLFELATKGYENISYEIEARYEANAPYNELKM